VDPSSLAGRVTELGRLDEALRTLDERGTALLVVGEPGIGQTALITEAARLARDRGMLVLASSGLLSEANLPHAGLHQLFRPVLRHAEELPGPQRAALLGAFRQVDEAVNDPVGVALAALSLLRDRSWESPASSPAVARAAHGGGGLPRRHEDRVPDRRERRSVSEVQGGHVFDRHVVPQRRRGRVDPLG